jgi:hypothetical protein
MTTKGKNKGEKQIPYGDDNKKEQKARTKANSGSSASRRMTTKKIRQ